MLFTSELQLDLQQAVEQVDKARFVVDYLANPYLPSYSDPTANPSGIAYMHTMLRSFLMQNGFVEDQYDASPVAKKFSLVYLLIDGTEVEIRFSPKGKAADVTVESALSLAHRNMIDSETFATLPYKLVGYLKEAK